MSDASTMTVEELVALVAQREAEIAEKKAEKERAAKKAELLKKLAALDAETAALDAETAALNVDNAPKTAADVVRSTQATPVKPPSKTVSPSANELRGLPQQEAVRSFATLFEALIAFASNDIAIDEAITIAETSYPSGLQSVHFGNVRGALHEHSIDGVLTILSDMWQHASTIVGEEEKLKYLKLRVKFFSLIIQGNEDLADKIFQVLEYVNLLIIIVYFRFNSKTGQLFLVNLYLFGQNVDAPEMTNFELAFHRFATVFLSWANVQFVRCDPIQTTWGGSKQVCFLPQFVCETNVLKDHLQKHFGADDDASAEASADDAPSAWEEDGADCGWYS
jgi:hypothetical protein